MFTSFRWRIALPYVVLIWLLLFGLAYGLARPLCGATGNCRTIWLWGAGLAAIGLSIVLGRQVAAVIVRPISQLTLAARRIATGDDSARLLPARADEIGQLTTAFNAAIDNLRRLNASLAQEQHHLATVLRTMGGGVIIADGDGRVQRINPAALALLEVMRKDVAGASLAEVMRHHRLIEAWQECRHTGQEQTIALEVYTHNQTTFWQVIITPLAETTSQGYMVLIQDLTEIHRLQSVRRDFVSNISHELRTPLASLKALIETVHDSALDDPPAARRFLQRAVTEVDTMTQMVEELLELARIESGKVPLRLQATSLENIVQPVVERLYSQAERAEVEVVLNLPDDLPRVLVDAERIQRVLTNLLHNAVKFTLPGGQIHISVYVSDSERPQHQKPTLDRSPMVVVAVRDSGVGIPPTDLPRIFERFYKTDRARSRGGTGLGLAIARHLVQAHGGEIWVKSKEGKGSTFSFSLPTAS
ncbi:MAG: HAMP domain-containing protein [Anaerolineales bacterium]|nr:HAMP domain-containing protein [Anaerolineales bacterium]MCB8953248.1 HAMP domain-containing protein [Ardenticatenales bacterium]